MQFIVCLRDSRAYNAVPFRRNSSTREESIIMFLPEAMNCLFLSFSRLLFSIAVRTTVITATKQDDFCLKNFKNVYPLVSA